MDEISERIGDLTRGVKTLARNQEKMMGDLEEVKVGLAVHCEREAAFEERLAKVEHQKPDYSIAEIVKLPVFWVAISIVGGLITFILGIPSRVNI